MTTTIDAGDGVRSDWLARYRVLFGATEAGVPTAEVEARLIWTAGAKGCPESLDVDMFTEDQFPKGYGSYVHGFAAILPEHRAALTGGGVVLRATRTPGFGFLRADSRSRGHLYGALRVAPSRFDGDRRRLP